MGRTGVAVEGGADYVARSSEHPSPRTASKGSDRSDLERGPRWAAKGPRWAPEGPNPRILSERNLSPPALAEPPARLYVGNLSSSMTPAFLSSVFSRVIESRILNLALKSHPQGQHAFVHFTPSDARLAIWRLNRTLFDGRTLVIEYEKPQLSFSPSPSPSPVRRIPNLRGKPPHVDDVARGSATSSRTSTSRR